MTGVELIQKERQRQIEVEGWTAEHDDRHTLGEMAVAGSIYARTATFQVALNAPALPNRTPYDWPWASAWWKPSADPIRNLVKAGALIAAEIDRLQREQENA